MPRYLDPRNDLVFKKIFGEHPNILQSFLNALLPLGPEEKIASLEYLPPEQVPQVPLLKNSIVDVRCKDLQGRQFIVEMQMNWTSAFLQRVLFNASKAYVRQLEKGERYELLQPVFGLSLLDDVFDHQHLEYYHHYGMVNVEKPEKVIEGLQLLLVELPKFKPTEKLDPLQKAWLRFMSETGEPATQKEALQFKEEVAVIPEIEQALDLAGESAFNLGELEAYDKFWDAVRCERTLIHGKYEEGKLEGRLEGKLEGLAEGKLEGLAEGEAKGKLEGRLEGEALILKKLLKEGLLTQAQYEEQLQKLKLPLS